MLDASLRTQNASSIQQVLPYGAVNSRRSSESSFGFMRAFLIIARRESANMAHRPKLDLLHARDEIAPPVGLGRLWNHDEIPV